MSKLTILKSWNQGYALCSLEFRAFRIKAEVACKLLIPLTPYVLWPLMVCGGLAWVLGEWSESWSYITNMAVSAVVLGYFCVSSMVADSLNRLHIKSTVWDKDLAVVVFAQLITCVCATHLFLKTSGYMEPGLTILWSGMGLAWGFLGIFRFCKYLMAKIAETSEMLVTQKTIADLQQQAQEKMLMNQAGFAAGSKSSRM